MNPSIDNAFSNGDSNQPSGFTAPGKSLASSLSPMQAKLTETDFGWMVKLSPIRAFDALRIWSPLTADGESEDGQEPFSLLFDVSLAKRESTNRELCSPQAGGALGRLADHFGIATTGRFCYESGDQLIMHDMAQRELIGMLHTRRMRSVLVAGPIEQRDAHAIVKAIDADISPLLVEFRAIAAIEVMRDRLATLQTREKNHALMLVAENFRHYLSAVRTRPVQEFAAPTVSQVERLMSVTGSMTIRPIETDVFSTSIDVGISSSVQQQNVPADLSLIYDVPSNTWHDEA